MPPPRAVILCDQKDLVHDILALSSHTKCDGCFSKLYLLSDHPGVAIGYFGSGADVLAPKMQELISWGVQEFISITTAGSLQKKAQMGGIVCCERAVRDERTSSHYLPSAKYIHAPRRMGTKVQIQLKKMQIPFHIASTWTVDALYPKTQEEITHYQTEGIVAIDRETSALFAVAHLYQVDLASLLVINNNTPDLLWTPDTHHPEVIEGLKQALSAAIHTLS